MFLLTSYPVSQNKEQVSDPLGLALRAYQDGDTNAEIIVHANGFDDEVWPAELFFQDSQSLQWYAKRALRIARGRILDVGAGAGSHSLILQRQGYNVEALAISPLAADVIADRGVKKVINADFFSLQTQRRYDTILFLMNGVGIAGRLANLPNLFAKCRELLAPDGQIIMDTTDFSNVYSELDLPTPTDRYVGEVLYTWEFQGQKSEPFWWLFADPDTLAAEASKAGFVPQLVAQNDDYHEFLFRMTLKD